jgi:malic enzyme
MKATLVCRAASTMITALFLATGAAAMAIAPAHADAEGDDAFIAYLDKKGFPYENRTEIIRLAKQFCLDQTRQGVATWVPTYVLQHKQKWTNTEAQTFIGGAIPVYCPQVWGG